MKRGEWVDAALLLLAGLLKVVIVGIIAVAIFDVAKDVMHPKPGPEWVHDRGSIYWTCTDSGRALIRDTDTGSTFLDRDDRKCDAGG